MNLSEAASPVSSESRHCFSSIMDYFCVLSSLVFASVSVRAATCVHKAYLSVGT